MLAFAKAAPAPGFLFLSGNDSVSVTYVWSALLSAHGTRTRALLHTRANTQHVEVIIQLSSKHKRIFLNSNKSPSHQTGCTFSSQDSPVLVVLTRYVKLQKMG